MTTATQNTMFRITDEHRRLKREQGYFITPVLFDERTINHVRSEFIRLWNELIEQTIQKQPEREWYSRNRPFLAQLHLKSELLAKFLKHPLWVNLAHDLLGADDLNQTWNQLIIKPPSEPGPDRGDNTFPWHQDARYALTEPMDAGVTIWFAVTETTIENGTLWAIPGVHKQGLLPHVWDDKARDWTLQIDTSAKEPVILEPGQALIFGRYVPHGSGPNITKDRVRMAYQIGYGPPGTVLKETGQPFGDQIPVMRGGKPVNS